MIPTVIYPDRTLLLPPRLMGSVGYYAAMAAYGHVIVDTAMRYDKRRKDVHRYTIVDARGLLTLTLPLGKPDCAPGARPTWADCAVSTHDEWWHRHFIALESAYGRTPYFEFLKDKFSDIYRSPAEWPEWPSAIDIDRRADAIIRGILGLDNKVEYRPVTDSDLAATTDDLRRHDFAQAAEPPYWQVRQALHGFTPHLSILDLIFNLGPTAPLHLLKYIQRPSDG